MSCMFRFGILNEVPDMVSANVRKKLVTAERLPQNVWFAPGSPPTEANFGQLGSFQFDPNLKAERPMPPTPEKIPAPRTCKELLSLLMSVTCVEWGGGGSGGRSGL
jgi:hypothetical protein